MTSGTLTQTSLQYERLDTLVAQFLGRPTATDTRPDDNGLVCICFFACLKVHPIIVFMSFLSVMGTQPINFPGIMLYGSTFVSTYSDDVNP